MRLHLKTFLQILLVLQIHLTVFVATAEAQQETKPQVSWLQSMRERAESSLNAISGKIKSWWYGDKKAEVVKGAQEQKANVTSDRGPAANGNTEPQPMAVAPTPARDTQATVETMQSIQKNKDIVQAYAPIRIATPAQVGASQLPKTKSGVPVFNVEKGKKAFSVPKLDIGTEAVISSDSFSIQHIPFAQFKPEAIEKLKSPTPMTVKNLGMDWINKLPKASEANTSAMKTMEELRARMVTQAKIDSVQWTLLEPNPIQLKPVVFLTAEDLLMLKALYLFRQDKCHLAVAFFDELKNDPKLKAEATYHLMKCTKDMGLNSAFWKEVKRYAGFHDKEFLETFVQMLPDTIAYDQEAEVSQSLKAVDFKQFAPDRVEHAYFAIGKAMVRSGNYRGAINHLEVLSPKFKKNHEAQFLKATAYYGDGQGQMAQKILEKLLVEIEHIESKRDLKTLASIQLARTYFQNKLYGQALHFFSKIEKDHPLWIDALLEQGWGQIMMGDYSGAIGNMYSMQSPYFKAVYKPESYVIRTIGYLNICQYGDAYRTLSTLEQLYGSSLNAMKGYLQNKKRSLDYYDTVKKYLSHRSDTNIDGLPYQVIREVARGKEFLNLQESINQKVDEAEQYKFLVDFIRKDREKIQWLKRKAQERIEVVKGQIAKSKQDGSYEKTINQYNNEIANEKNRINIFDFQLETFEESRKSFARFQKQRQTDLQVAKNELQISAGQELKQRMNKMSKDLQLMLENNELLRYEVFAGSGENIRYLSGGGEKEKRIPASVKPQQLEWSFEGEYWADEIGNYRSSLKNNCPKSQGESK